MNISFQLLLGWRLPAHHLVQIVPWLFLPALHFLYPDRDEGNSRVCHPHLGYLFWYIPSSIRAEMLSKDVFQFAYSALTESMIEAKTAKTNLIVLLGRRISIPCSCRRDPYLPDLGRRLVSCLFDCAGRIASDIIFRRERLI